MRFLARLGSGTLLKYQAGSCRSASAPPMEANNSLLPLSSGRPSTADQKAAIFGTSSQSKVMLPILAAMASSLVRGQDRRTGGGGPQAGLARGIVSRASVAA